MQSLGVGTGSKTCRSEDQTFGIDSRDFSPCIVYLIRSAQVLDYTLPLPIHIQAGLLALLCMAIGDRGLTARA